MRRLPTEIRRAQIAEAALQIIARDGLGAFTTSAISHEAGLSEGAIFRHFRNKQEIVSAAIERLGALLFAEPRPEPASDDPLEELRQFLGHRASLLRERPGYLRVLLSDQLAQAAGDEAREQVATLRRRSVEAVRQLIGRAVELGQVRGDVLPMTLTAIVQGLILFQVFSPRPLDRADEGDGGFELLWRDLLVVLGPQTATARSQSPAAGDRPSGADTGEQP